MSELVTSVGIAELLAALSDLTFGTLIHEPALT